MAPSDTAIVASVTPVHNPLLLGRLAVGRWPLAVGRLAVGRWPLAVGRWPLAVWFVTPTHCYV